MKVSIITPSFNQGQFILRTLESVNQQQDVQIEHVVMDGKSTDNTVDILKSASLLMPYLKWVSEKDNGQAHAVNKGIQATNGEIIGWLNSDDIYYPGAIQSVLQVFESWPNIDVIYGMADHIDIDDQPFETYPSEPWNEQRLQDICYICQPALFFRRSVVDKCGLLDESLNYCMDYEYWLRLAKADIRFYYFEKKLAGSRLYADNKTLGARVKVHAEINTMLKKHFGKVPERWLFNYAHVVADKTTDKLTRPHHYFYQVVNNTIRASFHWNKKLSLNTIEILIKWTISRIFHLFPSPS